MKILLKSTYPCLVKSKSEIQEISPNDTLEIENESQIFVYPSDCDNIPFYIDLNTPKDSPFYSFLSYGQKNILLLEKQNKIEVTHKETLNFSGKICQVEISKHHVSFENDKRKISCNIAQFCKDYKLSKIKNFACLQFDNDLYLFDMTKSKLTHLSANNFDWKDNNLNLTKKFHDSLNREKNATYLLDSEMILQKEEFVSQPTRQQIKGLTPYKFMESIKAKDYQYSFDCLSCNLQEKIDKSQIQQFFGNISSFLPLSEIEFITISNTNKNFIKFEISDEKINDILIDSL